MYFSKTQLNHVQDIKLASLFTPYNFDLTVHKPAGWDWLNPFERYTNGVVWTGIRITDDMPIGLKLRSVGSTTNSEILCNIYARSRLSVSERNEIEKILRRCLVLDGDISEFYTLAEENPILRLTKEHLWGMRDTPFPDLFTACIAAITLQMTPIKRAIQMTNLLYDHYGERVVFDEHEVILCPLSKDIVKIDVEELKTKCKLGYRSEFIKSAAEAIATGMIPSIYELETIVPTQVRRKLKLIRGIGDYSVDIMGIFPSFPIDSWSAKIFSTLFHLPIGEDIKKNTKMVKEYAEEEFGKWKGYAYTYILNDLPNLSKELRAEL